MRLREPDVRHAWQRLAVFLIATAVVLGSAPPEPASAADASASPFAMSLGKSVRGTNTSSTTEPGEPFTAQGPLDCGGRRMGRTRWFKITGTGRRMTIDTARSNFDTVLAVYSTTQPPSPATALACDAPSLGARNAHFTIPTALGAEYLIQLGGSCTPACASGTFYIQALDSIANDDRASAELMNCCFTQAMRSLTRATVEPGESRVCGRTRFTRTVWFRFIAPEEGEVTFTPGAHRRTIGTYDEASGRRLRCGTTIDGVTVSARKGQSLLAQVGTSSSSGLFKFRTAFAEDPDHDDDGFRRPGDCDDRNSRINEDAFDAPGDGVDRNCDGTDRPDLVGAKIELFALGAGRGKPILGISRVRVSRALRRSRVTVTCRGRACRRKQWTKRVARNGKVVNVPRPLKKSARKFGKVTIAISVTRDRLIGRVSRWTVRYKRRRAERKNLCLFPGARLPRKCRG